MQDIEQAYGPLKSIELLFGKQSPFKHKADIDLQCLEIYMLGLDEKEVLSSY